LPPAQLAEILEPGSRPQSFHSNLNRLFAASLFQGGASFQSLAWVANRLWEDNWLRVAAGFRVLSGQEQIFCLLALCHSFLG
jgi:hypothetical protein